MAKLIRTVKSALVSSEASEREKDAPTEQPVGNSQRMQSLRQKMQSLAHDQKPVFLSGTPGSGIAIWASYLFKQGSDSARTQTFQADMHLYQNGVFHNIFIAEVAELSMQSQRILLSVLQQPVVQSSTGRFVVASRFDYEALSHNREVLPELAEFWRQAIQIPSLNERVEDIPELVEYYVNWFSDLEGLPYRHFGVAAQNLMRNHDWQGGLHELKAFIRQLLSNSSADNVELAEINRFLAGGDAAVASRAALVILLLVWRSLQQPRMCCADADGRQCVPVPTP